MKIVFKSENGFSPEWKHDGIRYYLYEDYAGWTLMSKKIGFSEKTKFYRSKNGLRRVHPVSLLDRYFRGKNNVKYEKREHYHFYYWDGKLFSTDGERITIQYECRYERPTFDTYLECLNDAKEYLQEKYSDGQMVLQLN